MRIRQARDEDCAAIARLRRQTIRQVNAGDYPRDVVERWSAKENARTLRAGAADCRRWVAIHKGQVVGFCEHNLLGEVSRIYVHKDHLRKGIGSRLLRTAEGSLKRCGCAECRVESTVTGRAFYEASGYNLIQRAGYGDEGREPVYQMVKCL